MSDSFTFTGRLRSVRHAAEGIRWMLASQHNAWIHLAATVLVGLAGWALGLNRFEWCWIVAAIMAVWVAEALNTAFEHLCDVVSPEFHPEVKTAKDVAAGAVLMTAAGAIAVGLLVLGPHLLDLLSES